MKKRIDLITSKEYWREHVSNALYKHTKDLDPDSCDKLSKKIVDKYFMDLIKEIKKNKIK